MKFRFIDEATIKVIAGKGGDGCSSYRREKFIEFGGPDGGDGGRGGDVVLEASRNFSTLSFFRYRGIHRAQNGKNGSSKCCAGANGSDLVLFTPIGTHVFLCDEEGEQKVCELNTHGQRIKIASGGNGGPGNVHFKSSVNRAPIGAGKGKPPEEKRVRLSLRTISDIGIVGLPNCGKSTLLNTLTNTNSKEADYSFTTLRPHLGTFADDVSSYVLADIPGLIEGASEGRGCGHIFLRHVEKCSLILHVIDVSQSDINKAYDVVRQEIIQYDQEHHTNISGKPEIIVLNKTDLISHELLNEKISDFMGDNIITVSLLDFVDARSRLEPIRERLAIMHDKPKAEFFLSSGYK